jgi:hypothetical protein
MKHVLHCLSMALAEREASELVMADQQSNNKPAPHSPLIMPLASLP